MICNNPTSSFIPQIFDIQRPFDQIDQWRKNISIKNRLFLLQDFNHSLESHTRINILIF